MKVSFNPCNVYSYGAYNSYNNAQPQPVTQFSFQGAKSRKFLDKLLKTDNLKNIKVSFGDMVAAYQELGYDVILKRGSHASIPITDKVNMPLVIPHGEKCVHPLDLKRLKLIAQGDIQKALTV